ncbi:MAG: type I glyceraldehyde-3-phosphate dehydrogenase [Spirochaetaceae bacterium]|nr:type I glyceraldehyde-3-phosphate dehydrogenase [Spirochaetaceae bacterium]RKX76039.1 MAG: type I glyceraldehyde-3-phosphate dehydrogenase [Spirochaetota bacterium]RKX86603.1 MAG: type I glyceraldehyde-3-phosphate dehydrogenase [Spirochaetota bacterium]RKX96461.1 MAG: type I glyceraldehyde-3-phosphate dehydrogenase [Spirochaetota bacterium]
MKIAINGFGRIGRTVFKIAFERPGIDIVAINDITDPKTLAHLLKYDSTFGVYNRKVEVMEDSFRVDDSDVKIFAERNPSELPWGEMGVDVVIESTGIFRVAEGPKGGYKDHIKAGAKKVILTVPAKDEIDQTIVLGVNDSQLDLSNTAFSNASCTTNCLAPVVKVLNDAFGIEHGLMTTIHAYTNDQVILDLPHSDLRRARSAALNIIPTTTGAAAAVGKVIPELNGKLNGMSMRVPTPIGSVVDLVAQLSRPVSKEELNAAVKAAAEGSLKGVLEYTEDPIVSMDVKGNSHSSVFDAGSTMVMDNGFVKIISWYDNEFGYSTRVVDLAQKLI